MAFVNTLDKELLELASDRTTFIEQLALRKHVLIKWILRYRLLDARIPETLADPMWEEEAQEAYLEGLTHGSETFYRDHIQSAVNLNIANQPSAQIDVILKGHTLTLPDSGKKIPIIGCIMVLEKETTAVGFLKKLEDYKPALKKLYGEEIRVNWLAVVRDALEDKNHLWQRGVPLHVIGQS